MGRSGSTSTWSVWGVVEFENDYNITDMWSEISVALIAAVLDAVRNTALRFALEMDRLEVTGDRPTEARTRRSLPTSSRPSFRANRKHRRTRRDQVTQIGEINVLEGDLDSLLVEAARSRHR